METLKQTRVIDIITELFQKPEGMHVGELLSEVGGSATTLGKRLDNLIEEGLVEDEIVRGKPYRRMLRLTDEGRELARRLKFATAIFNPELLRRERLLLALLYAVGGEVRGRTRLEKLPFLLRHEFEIRLQQFYRYEPYPIGPFSKDLLESVSGLIMLGLIEEEEQFVKVYEIDEEVIRKTYRLTLNGRDLAQGIFKELPEHIKDAMRGLNRFNEMPLSELLEYVHTKYPDFLKSE